MKRIALLGSTGSIGQNALDVIRRFPREFSVTALSANLRTEVLLRQAREFSARVICVGESVGVLPAGRRLKVVAGEPGLEEIARRPDVDCVLVAISGSAALAPLLAAIDAGKQVLLANKEALVMAGDIIMRRCAAKKVGIIPIDSEQSAIWQCLKANGSGGALKKIFLTASGGPLHSVPRSRFSKITSQDVLAHPRWRMGRKITVDSATLMNKGLEVIEAVHLFAVRPSVISVVIHPEAIIHSMVEFVDGVILAQLSATDMRVPIQYALSFPRRLPTNVAQVDFSKLGALTFDKPDMAKFPCLGLAYEAINIGGSLPAVLNGANDVCVQEFLAGKLAFMRIPAVVEKVMRGHKPERVLNVRKIMVVDSWARERAREIIDK